MGVGGLSRSALILLLKKPWFHSASLTVGFSYGNRNPSHVLAVALQW